MRRNVIGFVICGILSCLAFFILFGEFFLLQSYSDPQTSKSERFAVLTLAKGIKPDRLFIFISSFRKYHDPSSTDLFIFCPEDEQYLQEYLQFAKELKINLEYFNMNTFDAKYGDGATEWHLNAWRFFVWKEWMDSNWQNYRAIFLSDSNDVAFNGNLFEIVPSDEKEHQFFFLEHATVRMGDSVWNQKYMNWCYTSAETERISPEVPSCAGTILGTSHSLLIYLELQTTHLRSRGRDCLIQGGDQAIHNFILRYHLLQDYGYEEHYIKNLDGWVLSMTLIPHKISAEEELNFRKTHRVVHQFKWWKNLREWYEAEYVYDDWKKKLNT